jgi:hypothetical protein
MMAHRVLMRVMPLNFTALGSPTFACTPDLFPDLMAAALNKQDVAQWAAQQGIVKY